MGPPKRGPADVMLSFFPCLLHFVFRDDRDAGAFRFLAPGLELAAAAQSPDPVSSVRVAAVQKDYPFAAAHQTAGLDLLRLPLETPELDCLASLR